MNQTPNYLNGLGISNLESIRFLKLNSQYYKVLPLTGIPYPPFQENAIYYYDNKLWFGNDIISRGGHGDFWKLDEENQTLYTEPDSFHVDLNQKDLKDVLNIYTENISGLPVQSPAEPLLNVVSNTDLNDKNLSNVNTAEITTGNILNINCNFIQGQPVEEGSPLLTINQKLLINNNNEEDPSQFRFYADQCEVWDTSDPENPQWVSLYDWIGGGGGIVSTYWSREPGYTPDQPPLFTVIQATLYQPVIDSESEEPDLTACIKSPNIICDNFYFKKLINYAEDAANGVLSSFYDTAGNKLGSLVTSGLSTIGGSVVGWVGENLQSGFQRSVSGFVEGFNSTLEQEKEFFNDLTIGANANSLICGHTPNYLGVWNRYNPAQPETPIETFIPPFRWSVGTTNDSDRFLKGNYPYRWEFYSLEDSHPDQRTMALYSYASQEQFNQYATQIKYAFGVSTPVGTANRLYNIGGDLYFNNRQQVYQGIDVLQFTNQTTLIESGLTSYNNQLYFNGVLVGTGGGGFWLENTSIPADPSIYTGDAVQINTSGAIISNNTDCLWVGSSNFNSNSRYISRFVNQRIFMDYDAAFHDQGVGCSILFENYRPSDYNSVKSLYRYNDHLFFGEQQLDEQVQKYINVSGSTTTPNGVEVLSAYVVYTDDDNKARLCMMCDQNGGSKQSGIITKNFGGDLSFSNHGDTAQTDLDHLNISTTGEVKISKNLMIYNNSSAATALQIVKGCIFLQNELYKCLIETNSSGIATFTGNDGDAERTFYLNTRGTGYSTNMFSFGEPIDTHQQNFTVAGSSYFGGSLTANQGINTLALLSTNYIDAGTYIKTNTGDIRLYDGTTNIGSIKTYSNVSRAGEYKLYMGAQGSAVQGLSIVVKGQTSGINYTGYAALNTEIDTNSTFTIKGKNTSLLKLINESNDTKFVDMQVDTSGYFNQYSTGNFFYNRTDNGVYCGYYPSSTSGSLFYLTTSAASDNTAKFEISSTAKTRMQLTYNNGGGAKTYLLSNDGTNVLEDLQTANMSYYLRRNSGASVVNRYALTSDHEFLDDTATRLFYLESSSRKAYIGNSSSYLSMWNDGSNGYLSTTSNILYLQAAGTNKVGISNSDHLMSCPRVAIYSDNRDALYIQGFG